MNIDNNQTITTQATTTIANDSSLETLSANDILNTCNEVYEYIKSVYGNEINATNIVFIASQLIQIIEKYRTLTGNQKKQIVINTIKKLINNSNIIDNQKILLNTIINNTLPPIIDELVNAINGNLDFDKIKEKTFFKSICCWSK